MIFEIIGEIEEIETIAIGGRVRDIMSIQGFRSSMVKVDGESAKGPPM